MTENLPVEVLCFIISYLSPRDVFSLRCVNKLFCAVSRRPGQCSPIHVKYICALKMFYCLFRHSWIFSCLNLLMKITFTLQDTLS